MKADMQKHTQLMELAGHNEKSTRNARKDFKGDAFSKMTRRVLAITVVGILAALTVGVTYWPVFVEVKETIPGFLFLTDDRVETRFEELKGAVVLQEFRLILIAVFGLYFGNNHGK